MVTEQGNSMILLEIQNFLTIQWVGEEKWKVTRGRQQFSHMEVTESYFKIEVLMKLENRYIWKDFKNEVPELCNALKSDGNGGQGAFYLDLVEWNKAGSLQQEIMGGKSMFGKCFSKGFGGYDETPWPKSTREFILAYSSISHSVTEGSQGRNQERKQELGTNTETMDNHFFLT